MSWEDMMVRIRTMLMLAFLAVIVGITSGKDPKSIRGLLLDHIRQYPKMEIQDIYKLVFQATMGNEHMMGDVNEIRKYLDEELAVAEQAGDGQEVEPLDADSTVVRINLKAFKSRKGDAAALLNAMIATASRFKKDPDLLKKYWSEVQTLASEKQIPFALEDLKSFFVRMELKNFPAVHHSRAYEDAYHPAYRVILRDAL
jgi:hypothetical protein